VGVRVRAKRVDDIDAPGTPPGAFELYEGGKAEDVGMIYVCPCGCGIHGFLHFRPGPAPSWTWDGNREAPTLTPSVHHQIRRTEGPTTTHWHGYLRAGWWESC
jgi:hypothetical protein